MTRVTRPHRGAHRAAGALPAVRGLLAAAAVLGAASCSGGAIAQSTPLNNPQSFVSGSYSSTYYAPGSRPAAPRFSSSTLTGARFSLAAQRGRLVVLNFWGSWCAPCRAEAPALAALAAFERTFGISYPSMNDPGEQVALAFHGAVPPVGIPTTLLIDRTGHISGRIVGEVSYRGLRALITRILARPS